MNWAKVENSRFQIFFFFLRQKSGKIGENVTGKQENWIFWSQEKQEKLVFSNIAILFLDELS